MKIRVTQIPEPKLHFGENFTTVDPKEGFSRGGPFFAQQNKEIRLGLVALKSEVAPIKRWIERLQRPILSEESNALRFKEYPGADAAFRCRFELPDRFIQPLDEGKYALIMANQPYERFLNLLTLYEDSIKSLFHDQHPDCILVSFPEEVATFRITNPRLSYEERAVLERLKQEEEDNQLTLFEPTEEERRLAAELMPQAEELLFRNFHRALKAKCMLAHNSVPLQIIRRWTYINSEAKQSEATRAWNLGVALYYKASNIPWRPHDVSRGTCFVGVSFHHLKRRAGDMVYACVAQAFSNDIEPFALRGEQIPRDQSRGKQPYLTSSQAASLAKNVMASYMTRVGSPPARVVIHKTSSYQPEEEEGFRKGLLDIVPACDLVWIRPTGFRLLRRGMREPLRGTLCVVEDQDCYLFTTGYVSWWEQYPGPHIPAPLQIGICGGGDIEQRAREILALTKMNWNSAEGIGRHPITLSFARRVGTMMTEMDEEATPNPSYRYYM